MDIERAILKAIAAIAIVLIIVAGACTMEELREDTQRYLQCIEKTDDVLKCIHNHPPY